MVQWEYRHLFIEAQKLEGTGKRGGLFGTGAEKMQNVYAWEEINQQLNELGAESWELLQAEPHWIWGHQIIGAPLWARMANEHRRRVEASNSYPEYIVGWYCTLRRQVG